MDKQVSTSSDNQTDTPVYSTNYSSATYACFCNNCFVSSQRKELEAKLKSRLKRTAIFTAGLLAFIVSLITAWGFFYERRTLRLNRMRVELPTLPDDLPKIRVAFFSDLHLDSRPAGHKLLAKIRSELERIEPDLILIGGDYYNHGIVSTRSEDFARIAAIAPTYGVLGNHDHNRGPRTAEPTIKLLKKNGIVILRNQSVNLTIHGHCCSVIGVDDPFTWRDRTSDALAEADDKASLRILLAHAPQVIGAVQPGDCDIALVGHTHSGQIRLSPTRTINPLDANWWLDTSKYRPTAKQQRDLHWDNGTLMYVTNGVGTTGLPIRFMAPPELVILEFNSGPGDSDLACDDPDRYVTRD